MAKSKTETVENANATARIGEVRGTNPTSLASLLSKKPEFFNFSFWLVGDTPLITHAWSEKARREMLQKQVKAVKGGKEVRDPEADFTNSLYPMGEKTYGFPAMGVKNAILSAAHKDKGIARSSAMGALWIDAEMVRTRPAFAGSVCDMPLLRIFGSAPEMREDMVKIGSGLSKIANLAYRGQFANWAMRITGRLNSSVLTVEQLAFLVDESGMSSGLGEWRIERRGMFGSFHMANLKEEAEWESFAAGNGTIPIPANQTYSIAAE